MKHQTGDKFAIDGASLNIEIQGCFPGAQGRSFRIMENSYQITVNGIPMDITERHLDMLKDAVRKVKPVKVEEPKEPEPEVQQEPAEQQPMEQEAQKRKYKRRR